MKDHLQSQLNAVERLQYQLTCHELQFAQRMAQKEQEAAEQIKVTVVSSSSDSNEGECDFDSLHVILSEWAIFIISFRLECFAVFPGEKIFPFAVRILS